MTPPVLEAAERVLQALSTGCSSSMLVGKPRLGKTFAARWICHAANDILGPVSWYEVPIQVDTSRAEGIFFSHILRCLPHEYEQCRSRDALRSRTEEFLIERASESPLLTVIVLLDEAHNLSERHWTYLAELSNAVDRAGFSLFTLSTGQTSLYVMRNTLRELSAEHNGDFVLGRFYLDMIDFRGLRSENDIKLTMHEIDESPVGPEDSRLWLATSLPSAYQGGFRLEQLAGIVWEAYADIWRVAGRKDNLEIPMTFFDLFVRQILGNPEKFDRDPPTIDLGVAKLLITASKFVQYIY